MTTKKHFAKDLIEHACAQLVKRARQHVKTGVRPATAARLAIRETQTLFPYDWRLAVQGDDADDHVEVWEAAHKRSSPIASISVGVRSHSTKRKRWNHGDVARAHGTSEDVVRRIYAAVQTAKKQGLYGGHTADLIERQLGRRLMGREYTVSALAHEHLQHKPLSCPRVRTLTIRGFRKLASWPRKRTGSFTKFAVGGIHGPIGARRTVGSSAKPPTIWTSPLTSTKRRV